MPKQRLEGDFSSIVRAYPMVWAIKLQVHPLAHTKMPADFIILGKVLRTLVECKQCKGKAFTFDRLTQKDGLLEFDNFHRLHRSYVLICFWRGSKKKSKYYLVPIKVMCNFMEAIPKKSANMKDFENYIPQYITTLEQCSIKF